MYQNQINKIRQESVQQHTPHKGRSIDDCRSSNVVLRKMMDGIHSSHLSTSIVQGVFKKSDKTTVISTPPAGYDKLNEMEKAIFDILKEKEETIILGDNIDLKTLKTILITNITDREFVASQGYVFTHETTGDSFKKISKSKAILDRATTKKADSRSQNDATRTSIPNPVFTRLTSAKTGRTASSGSTGNDRGILIVISPLASLRDNPKVKGGSSLVGCYNEDVGKMGRSRVPMSPKTLADMQKQNAANEQHWERGIDLEQNAIGIAIKVIGEKKKEGLSLYSGNMSGNKLENKDEIIEDKLLEWGKKEVRDAVSHARSISKGLAIKGISPNFHLNGLHVLFST